MDLKSLAARQAVTLVRNGSTVGLGAGATIAHVVGFLKEEKSKGLAVKVLTSSFVTRQLLITGGFDVVDVDSLSVVDLYLDGCDQLDKDLHALKSGGGIHTHEKLLASMAREFVLIGDETKYCEKFDGRFPLAIEVIPEAIGFVRAQVEKWYPSVKILLRMADKTEGAALTRNGNYLFDLWFTEWPSLETLNPSLKSITGVLETSLFYNLAKKALIAGENGVRILEK
jgi:ribose 5-phosphate isomerase A